jgi:hypothetical protein
MAWHSTALLMLHCVLQSSNLRTAVSQYSYNTKGSGDTVVIFVTCTGELIYFLTLQCPFRNPWGHTCAYQFVSKYILYFKKTVVHTGSLIL